MPKYKQGSEDKYAMKGAKVMGHEKSHRPCNAFAAQRKDMGRISPRKMDYRGTPEQAFGYKY
jgi:hypothetical protein